MVKLAPADLAPSKGAVAGRTLFVLQVTLSSVPRESSSCTKIWLAALTLVVLTWHVPVEAFVAQEKAPAAAVLHVTTEGFAAVPTPAQLELVK